MEKEILFFYGTECPHCLIVEKHVDKLIEEGYVIRKVEVWHNKENDKWLETLDIGENSCGGVPFFLNQITGQTICGEATYQDIKNWATKK